MNNSTICAIATAHGGAIGIIRVSGEDSIAIVNKTISKDILNVPANSFYYTKFYDNNKNIIDDVIVSIYKNPHSYTGEDSVEISCHDSTYILQNIMNTLIENGCESAKPGEYTMRAFLNGKMDLSQAEAVADVIASANKASHDIAINQLSGGFSKEIGILRDKLLEMCSYIELELDFSEEDVEFVDRDKLMELIFAIQVKLYNLIRTFNMGKAIKDGIPVAIIGAPNVGKSTLLNALLEEDKAITSNIPGTTRDIIEDTTNINGICFRFIDTAGIRETDDTIEKLGIERSYKSLEKALIVISLADPNNDFIDYNLKKGQEGIKIINKTDSFSALNGIGIDNLKEYLVDTVGYNNSNDVIVTNTRHIEILNKVYDDIKKIKTAIIDKIPTDLIAENLKICINHLNDVVGDKITSQDVLNNIFSHFCIGK